MSRVRMPGICYCECHEPGSFVMHNFACCMGKCPVCKKRYMYAAHVDDCQKRIADLMAEAKADG